jgi:hypothetical protein
MSLGRILSGEATEIRTDIPDFTCGKQLQLGRRRKRNGKVEERYLNSKRRKKPKNCSTKLRKIKISRQKSQWSQILKQGKTMLCMTTSSSILILLEIFIA